MYEEMPCIHYRADERVSESGWKGDSLIILENSFIAQCDIRNRIKCMAPVWLLGESPNITFIESTWNCLEHFNSRKVTLYDGHVHV